MTRVNQIENGLRILGGLAKDERADGESAKSRSPCGVGCISAKGEAVPQYLLSR